jgi:IclR family transcriptional regulator, KDG regulon repressor
LEVIKSAQRVCEVFEFFQEARRPLALKDFVARLQYPPSSASVLLKSLVELGYLEYDLTHRAYFPTMRMTSMVGWVERARFGNGSVVAAMRRLQEATSETVSLGAQSDLLAQYVFQIPGVLPIPYPRLRQTVRPIEKSGLGWLLLSALPDDHIERLLKRINYRSRDKNRITLGALMQQVNAVRSNGYVFSRHTVVQGAGLIGMLIRRGSQGARQLALSIHGPVTRLEKKKELILRELAAVTTAAGVLE